MDLTIPRDVLVVFTGVYGSGKSSLAFDTLYAEAQRRYLESVSPYARRLFHQMAVPEVDAESLPPTVALQQRGTPTTTPHLGTLHLGAGHVRLPGTGATWRTHSALKAGVYFLRVAGKPPRFSFSVTGSGR